MTSQSGQLSVPAYAGRLENFRLAWRRFGETLSPSALSGAWHRFTLFWPIWIGGLELAVVAALVLDTVSVNWVRGHPVPVTGFFQWITVYGKSDWLLIPLGAACLLLLFGDWRNVGRRLAAAWTELGILAGFAFISIAGAGIATNIFKQSIGRWRPVRFDEGGAFSFTPLQFDYAHASFPSGHSTTMGALAIVIVSIVPRHKIVVLAACFLVAASRVFVGSHFPSDVVGGFLVGAAFSWFYAQTMAGAQIGFARTASGTIRARTVAIRKIFGQPGGLSIAVSGLLTAFVGHGSRSDQSV